MCLIGGNVTKGRAFFSSLGNGGKIGKFIVLGSSQSKGLKGSLALISMTAALGLGYYMNINSSGAQAAQKKRLVFSWGAGTMGQLGIGSEIVNKNLPTEIQAF